MLPMRTLVLGGASSGKSAYAEKLCVESALDRVYIATAEAYDDEMREKIARHRDQRGPDWVTIEAPRTAADAISGTGPGQIVLLDCVTFWLSNHLLAESDLEQECAGLLAAFRNCPSHLIVVTNEVGQGVVPDSSLGRRFRDWQGRLNQQLADEADRVVAVMAGLPLELKGPAR